VEHSTLDRPPAARRSTGRRPFSVIEGALPRITVVDDNDDFVALIAEIFSGRFAVAAARDPLLSGLADTRPQLLIIGPRAGGGRLDGWERVKLVRRHRELRGVPIVVCTTGLIALDVDGERLAEYADVYLLAVPFSLEVLEGLVGHLIPHAATATA
jgi:CheY-like chemotaxis protein